MIAHAPLRHRGGRQQLRLGRCLQFRGGAVECVEVWTEGHLFISRAYVLLVFAGIWALMQGITTIVRAFEIRDLRERL